MKRKPEKPPEGAKMKVTADYVAWKKDFEKISLSEHEEKLRQLGLDDEDINEFDQEFEQKHPGAVQSTKIEKSDKSKKKK